MKKLFISLAVIALAASYSYAGNVQTFGIGARATAQGEAVVAHADDPFAVYYNPAGLSLIKRPVISVGTTLFDAKAEIKNFSITSDAAPGAKLNSGASDFETTGDLIVNPTIGFAMPINDKWSFGIAAYAPYGLRVEWDRDIAKNPGALYAWESQYVRQTISPTLAYKFTDKLSVGFGVSLGRSITDSGKTIPNQAGTTNELSMELVDDFNYSFNAGIMYRPVDAISLGLTYRGRTDADFEGDVFLDGTKIGTASLDLDHPESVQAGARYFFTDNFSMEVDATWTRWSIIENQVQVVDSPFLAPLLGEANPFNEPYERNWEDTIQYKIGGEWKLAKNFALRAGYTYDPTPVPDDTFDMGWPDTDRNVYNVGFGWDINENWTIDGVVQSVRSTSVRKLNGESDNMNAVYGKLINAKTGLPEDSVKVSLEDEGILWGYGINISYRF